MEYFPVFMKLKGLPVLVVGGGQVASRKVHLLSRAGAHIRIVAKCLHADTAAMVRQGLASHHAEAFEPAHLDGVRLAYAATDDTALNARVFREAERRGVPVNAVDDPEHCRFITPAIIDRSPVQVAVSTAGNSPVLATRLRSVLERLLPEGLGRVATAAGRIRRRSPGQTRPADHRFRWEQLMSWRNIIRWSGMKPERVESEMESAFAGARPEPGRVVLVGAGPGDPDLLTLRALHYLGQADVILHDRLVPDAILQLARRDARQIDVGKRAGSHSMDQARINRTLLNEARKGKLVVRLKGGDPFIFGRGGEELQFLTGRGIDCEVVAGISAAQGVAGSTAIPLTHRDFASQLTFVTGHKAGTPDEPDWGSLAGPDRTLAIYMGTRKAAAIRSGLLNAGIDARLPAALIINGTLPTQDVHPGTVATLPDLASRMKPGDVGLLIIGEVAGLARANETTWPVKGKKVA